MESELNEYLFTGCTCQYCLNLQQEALEESRKKWASGERNITFKSYHYTCEDGCCDDYGTTVHINGFQLAVDGSDTESTARAILAFLNIDGVKTEWQYDE